MPGAIFLSASVPDPQREPKYAQTAEPVAIAAAVSALLFVTLGRRRLIWGGHPAITPMIWVVAEDLGVNYGEWVHLYQSKYFEDKFPQDNEKFKNVTFTESVNGDRDESLLHMRRQMFSKNKFSAAVFIGGMSGVIEEFDLLRELQPNASLLPIVSTGAAAMELGESMSEIFSDLKSDLDYVSLFHRRLDIDAKERRRKRPEDRADESDDPPKNYLT